MWIKMGFCLQEWTYTSKAVHGKCRIDGEKLAMKFRLKLSRTHIVPDVLAVERWLVEKATSPATVEEYARDFWMEWGCVGGEVVVVGFTKTHGKIKARICDKPRRIT